MDIYLQPLYVKSAFLHECMFYIDSETTVGANNKGAGGMEVQE